jgi:hypothetical protein
VNETSLYAFGTDLELFGALALWVVLFARFPSARRSHQQTMLLLAVAGLNGSITVYLAPVAAVLNRTFVFADSCDLFMNAWGVLSSALILDFVLAAVSRRRPWLVYGATAGTIAALVVLNFTFAPHAGCVTSEAVPWYSAFWWLLIAAHLVGTVPCAVLCVRCAHQARGDRTARLGLRLLAVGFVSSSVFWGVVCFGFLLARPPLLAALFPLNIGITAWVMSAAVALPLLLTAYGAVRHATALLRLRPLWGELTDAVPHVALEKRRPPVREVLGSPHTLYFRLYRQVVEIRDALLVLQGHVTPEEMAGIRSRVAARELPPEQVEPAVVACWLEPARQARMAGEAPGGAADGPAQPIGHDLRSEIDFLRAVMKARSRHRAPVRAVPVPKTRRT